MIRINLLAARPKSAERLDALLSPGGRSTFISGREALLGGLFLVLTVVILAVLAYRFSSSGEEGSEALAAAEAGAEAAEVMEPEPSAAPVAPAPAPPDPEPLDPEAEPAAAPSPAQPDPDPPPPDRAPALPAPAIARTAETPASPARTLTALRVTPLADRVDIFLEMSDAPRVDSFNVESPPRVVVDIPGTLLQVADGLRNQPVDSPLVSRLRIAQNTFDPPRVRLVLDVPAFPSTRVIASADGLSIQVTAAQ